MLVYIPDTQVVVMFTSLESEEVMWPDCVTMKKDIHALNGSYVIILVKYTTKVMLVFV